MCFVWNFVSSIHLAYIICLYDKITWGFLKTCLGLWPLLDKLIAMTRTSLKMSQFNNKHCAKIEVQSWPNMEGATTCNRLTCSKDIKDMWRSVILLREFTTTFLGCRRLSRKWECVIPTHQPLPQKLLLPSLKRGVPARTETWIIPSKYDYPNPFELPTHATKIMAAHIWV